jgi:DNA helicase-2/ATP-dependent DNA helicase PcrA
MSGGTRTTDADVPLTGEQRAIVEAPDGPVVVIAGAGTGKTRVIVERVRWLLATKGERTPAGSPIPAEPAPRHGNPFDGPLSPEQLLVLTYNVKAAAELGQRLDAAVGPATRARMSVSNFHSFCQRILTESAADAGLPQRPDVLDGVGQVLLLRQVIPALDLRYHGASPWSLGGMVGFINRAKDELVDPGDFEAFVAVERDVYEQEYGDLDAAIDRLGRTGHLEPVRDVRSAYARVRANQRAEAAGLPVKPYKHDDHEKVAEREARRNVIGTGALVGRNKLDGDQLDRIDQLADSYVRDGAALEVLRLDELARVYRAYEEALAERGLLDFGEQIALVARLFKTRPNVLRRWQRQYRYILVDEFQDANVPQIELIELLGRTPDRPDNVMVVGDDDQSIYRFRGASFAAFAEFDARFSRPPAHAPDAPAPGTPRHLAIEQNFRSVRYVLDAANRLIGRNETRFAPDKRLHTTKPEGVPIELLVCGGAEDEAVAIVDAIRAFTAEGRAWNDVAVLYRKHKHRDAIVERLRAEDIPFTIVGGLSLFETPEIRDLEQALRAIADPTDDAALVRMMTAGPWRLDALEILRVSRDARFDTRHLVDAAHRMVMSGEATEDVTDRANGNGAEAEPGHAHREAPVDAALRAKLRNLLAAIEELNPRTWRDGPHSILERYLELNGTVLDLLAVGTLEAKRSVVTIASFLRFTADWQLANPGRTLADFIEYLEAFKAAGGELPTSVELSEDVEGVRLMTLYQAKGLEFPVVIVPDLLDGEWPVKEQGSGWFPRELLREQVPGGNLHLDEERRLLYVAITRAQERVLLTTHGGTAAKKAPSVFVGELLDGAGPELTKLDRTLAAAEMAGAGAGENADADGADADGADAGDAAGAVGGAGVVDAAALAAARQVLPLPSARERRLALRLRASELIGLMEATAITDPEAEAARARFEGQLRDIGRAAAMGADEARAAGLDPLTFRTLALDTGAGANLLTVAPLPGHFSYSALSQYEACPLRYALAYVYRIPEPARPAGALSFGSTAHAAFEAFTRERRERAVRGESMPTRDDLGTFFAREWTSQGFPDAAAEAAYTRRIDTMLDSFFEGELSTAGEALAEEQDFALVLVPDDGSGPVRISGGIDRIDRLPSGGIEVIDYKTGRVSSQKDVSENLQLTIYALACRDALDLGTPERVTLYFTESAQRMSTTRTDEQLDAARVEILDRVARIRAGEFTATPGKACQWCNYRAMCPERV